MSSALSDSYLYSQVSVKQHLPDEAEQVFEGTIFSVYQWQQEMYDGSFETFEKLKRSSSVGILPVTMDGKILLTSQEQPHMQPFTSVPGGIVDSGEAVFDAAQRELLEETGYTAKKWKLWYGTQLVTKIDWTVFMFVAIGCEKVQDQQLDAGEKIRVEKVAFADFLDKMFDPKFRDEELTLRILKEYYHDPDLREFKALLEL